jgi:hypothetical protein
MSNMFNGTTPAPPCPQYGNYWSGGGESLGLRTNTDNIVFGKVVVVGQITPADIHSIPGLSFNLQQSQTHRYYKDGEATGHTDSWTDDTALAANQSHTPDIYDKIYALDAPNAGMGSARDSKEQYDNFYNYITFNGVPCSQTNCFWHFQARFKSDSITLADLGEGNITLPTDPFYTTPNH